LNSSLTIQELSEVVWAAGGLNRPDTGGLVNSTAKNSQDLMIYGIMAEGIYRYNKKSHILSPVVEGNYRSVAATPAQSAVAKAPAFILLASNPSLFLNINATEQKRWSALSVGHASQFVLLWTAANGLVVALGRFRTPSNWPD
jgi:hypothetical protein